MIISDKWLKKALQHKGIKGEHAYLQAIKDVIRELNKETERLNKLAVKNRDFIDNHNFIIIRDLKLNLFNTNKKKK